MNKKSIEFIKRQIDKNIHGYANEGFCGINNCRLFLRVGILSWAAFFSSQDIIFDIFKMYSRVIREVPLSGGERWWGANRGRGRTTINFNVFRNIKIYSRLCGADILTRFVRRSKGSLERPSSNKLYLYQLI